MDKDDKITGLTGKDVGLDRIIPNRAVEPLGRIVTPIPGLGGLEMKRKKLSDLLEEERQGVRHRIPKIKNGETIGLSGKTVKL